MEKEARERAEQRRREKDERVMAGDDIEILSVRGGPTRKRPASRGGRGRGGARGAASSRAASPQPGPSNPKRARSRSTVREVEPPPSPAVVRAAREAASKLRRASSVGRSSQDGEGDIVEVPVMEKKFEDDMAVPTWDNKDYDAQSLFTAGKAVSTTKKGAKDLSDAIVRILYKGYVVSVEAARALNPKAFKIAQGFRPLVPAFDKALSTEQAMAGLYSFAMDVQKGLGLSKCQFYSKSLTLITY